MTALLRDQPQLQGRACPLQRSGTDHPTAKPQERGEGQRARPQEQDGALPGRGGFRGVPDASQFPRGLEGPGISTPSQKHRRRTGEGQAGQEGGPGTGTPGHSGPVWSCSGTWLDSHPLGTREQVAMQALPTQRQVPGRAHPRWTTPRSPSCHRHPPATEPRLLKGLLASAVVSTSRVGMGAPVQGRCPGCLRPLLTPEAEGLPRLPGLLEAGREGGGRTDR